MKQPTNPYVAGLPLRGERGFSGRQDILDWVARELRNPSTNALVLFGQRRIGKTTLLLQLERVLPTDTFLPVYFDLQDQATRPLGRVLADLADTAAERASLELPDVAAFDDEGRFFRRQFLPQLHEALGDNRRSVFLLDEFDVLDQVAEGELPETAAAKALFSFLRRTMIEETRPAFIFVVGRRAEDLSLDFTATFKASLVREVWVLDRQSAEALVRQAETNGTLSFTDRAVARVLSLTSCHPYLTQLLCQRIWEQAYAGNPSALPLIDVPDIETAIPDALEAGSQALVWVWDGLSPAEKIYASALAEIAGEEETIFEDRVIQVLAAHAARLRTREVELAPRDLIRRRVLEVAGERGYRFTIELFRQWVCRNKPLQDVKDELDRVVQLAEQFFGPGQELFRRRRWEDAIRYFRDAIEANPRHFRARLSLGEALLELGQTDEAVAELEQAYELDREETRLPLARALIAQAKAREKEGDEEGALAACGRALETSPNERAAQDVKAAIWTRRGDAALEQNDLEVALAAYREARNVEGIARVGDAALEKDDLKKALAAYRELAATEKIAQVGEMALSRNDLETAWSAYREMGDAERVADIEMLQRRRALEALEAEASAHERAEKWAEAATAYEQLVAQAPDRESHAAWQAAVERCREEKELDCLFMEGTEALARRDWEQAQRAFADVVYRHPDYAKDGQLAVQLLERAIVAQKAAAAVPARPVHERAVEHGSERAAAKQKATASSQSEPIWVWVLVGLIVMGVMIALSR